MGVWDPWRFSSSGGLHVMSTWLVSLPKVRTHPCNATNVNVQIQRSPTETPDGLLEASPSPADDTDTRVGYAAKEQRKTFRVSECVCVRGDSCV